MQADPRHHALPDAQFTETVHIPKVSLGNPWLMRIRRFLFSGVAPVVAIIALPILLHLPALLGIIHPNALASTAQISLNSNGFIAGDATIDPNNGYTTQALGHLAAKMWLSGQIPWWNPYEGIGVPLAGEMQSAAFFPLTLLFIFAQGQLLFQISLQIIAGVSTYFLIKELGLSKNVALIAAILFEFNGIFVWLTNAPENPVPFLPLLLLGIERAFHASQTRQRHGWRWITIALALSLLAGFPETAYLDGLLAGVWVVVRFAQGASWQARLDFGRRVMVGFFLGLMIASPLLIAFYDFLQVSNVGPHSGDFAFVSHNIFAFIQNLYPYAWGNIFQYPYPTPIFLTWSGIGGYTGLTMIFLAFLGLFGKRDRALRFALLGWIIAVWGKTYGFLPLVYLFNTLPLVKEAAFFRYAVASTVFAGIILAAFALNDLFEHAVNWRLVLGSALGVGGMIGILPILLNIHEIREILHATPERSKYFYSSILLEGGAFLLLVGILLFIPQIRRKITLIGIIVCCLTIGYYSYPSLASPRQVDYQLGGVTYLQKHTGLQRFYTLGPYRPNYGSYFETASINYNDLPTSAKYLTYIQDHLDVYGDPILFVGQYPRATIDIPDQASELRRNLTNYENTGVKYIVTFPGLNPFNQTTAIPITSTTSQTITLGAGETLSGQLSESLARNEDLASIGIPLTIAAEGTISLQLCQQTRCVNTQATVGPSLSKGMITLTPSTPLAIDDTGTPVTYSLHFEGASDQSLGLALWQVPDTEQQHIHLGGADIAASALALTLTHQVRSMALATPVYQDAVMWIYELPDPAPFFAALNNQCQVQSMSWTDAQVQCAQQDTLLRRSLSMAGWHVSIDGEEAPIEEAQGIFQQVTLPAGMHSLHFWYLPPLAEYGIMALIIALVALALSFVPVTTYERARNWLADRGINTM